MISIARTFGAPDTVPAGKARHQRIERVVAAARRPTTFETMCITWE